MPSVLKGLLLAAQLLVAVAAWSQPVAAALSLSVEGRLIAEDGVLLHAGRLVVAVETVAPLLGLSFQRDGDTVRVESENRWLQARVGEGNAQVDGVWQPLDVPVAEVDGRVVVPLRSIAQLVDMRVHYRSGRLELTKGGPGEPAAASAEPGPERGEPGAVSGDSEDAAEGAADAVSQDAGPEPPAAGNGQEREEREAGPEAEVRRLSWEERRQRREELAKRAERLVALREEPAAHGESRGIQAQAPRPQSSGQLRTVYGVEVEWRERRQWVHVHADQPLPFTTHMLADPPRLVVDIPGARWAAEPLSLPVGGPVIQRVRAQQHGPETVRVVVDLEAPTRARGWPRGGGLSLALNQLVGGVHVWAGPSGPVIDLPSSGPLEPQVLVLTEPYRLVIDLPHASLVGGAREGEGPIGPIQRWRLSQFQPDAVRLVLELDKPLSLREAAFVPASADEAAGAGHSGYAGVWRLQLGPALEAIGVHPIPGGRAVVLEGESALAVQLSRLRDPQRVLIDLPGAVLSDAGWGYLPVGDPGGVQQVRVARNRPDLVRVVVDTAKPMAYRLHRSEDGRRAVVELRDSPLAGWRVVIDPGHGGYDQGARGVTGVREAELNLDVAQRLFARLREEGAEVYLTRADDTYVPLPDRPQLANRLDADIFISIHHNSCPGLCVGGGTETYYLPTLPENAMLAAALQDELVRHLGLPDRGVKERDLSVLRHAAVPAVLVEVAFLNNPREELLLRDPAFRDRVADALLSGLRRYAADLRSVTRPGAGPGNPAVAAAVNKLLTEGVRAAALQLPLKGDAIGANRDGSKEREEAS